MGIGERRGEEESGGGVLYPGYDRSSQESNTMTLAHPLEPYQAFQRNATNIPGRYIPTRINGNNIFNTVYDISTQQPLTLFRGARAMRGFSAGDSKLPARCRRSALGMCHLVSGTYYT